jgi:hypothetical protein
VRELVVRKRLEALARDAAERLRELVRSGEEIPFAVAGPGDGSPFAQYVPQTDRFVREHWAELAALDAFGEACGAIGASSLGAPYLDSLGEPVPPSEDRCCEAAAIAFLTRLCEGSPDFSFDDERLAAVLDEIDGRAEASESEAEIVAPLVGFQMPAKRLSLATTTIVRADLVAVPDEVRRSEGTGRSGFEPQFLAVVQGSIPTADDDADERAGGASSPGAVLRKLVTVLRLFKPGSVGLGPYAWAHTAGDRWRRLATGATPPRRGGYRLTEHELGDLAALSRTIARSPTPLRDSPVDRPGPAGTLTRAISRFEVGLERPTPLEAVSDYVLTLRYLLEGAGAADVGVPMRVAALSAEPAERPAVKDRIARAVELERALVRGELLGEEDGERSLELVAELEEGARSLLRMLARGELGADPRAAADEALLADGLSVGEGAEDVRGETAEWEAIQPQPHPTTDPVAPGREAEDATGIDAEEAIGIDSDLQETPDEPPTRVLMGTETNTQHAPPPASDADAQPPDWLSEVDSRGDTLDWPARPEALKLLDRRPAERERARKRVRHLFPRPETTEWRVAELQYERRRSRSRV